VKAFALALGVVLLTATAAQASTTIEWTGQGSDNLPCDSGGHWVLTGQGITSATMIVNGVQYVMTQNGNGSFAADSVGALDENTTASATYEGEAANVQFVLSHCEDESPSPSPSESPSPSPSESPSPTGSSSTPRGSSSTPPTRQAPHPSSGSTSVPPTAFTGGSFGTPLAIGAVLLVLGLGSLLLRRRFS
jgi:hypothetical protein